MAGAALLAMGANTASAQLILPNPLLPPLPILSNVTHTVSVINDSPWFIPMRTALIMGDSVKWTNLSQGTHTITSLYMAVPQLTDIDTAIRDGGFSIGGIFDRRAFGPGQEFTVNFPLPGTFPYICFIHPYMAGNVTVSLPLLPLAQGPVPDIIQGPNTTNAGLPSNNGFGPGVGEVCMTADMEKPVANLPGGVVHCVDAKQFKDLPLADFQGNPQASIRSLAFPVDTSTPGLNGRKIGGRWEGIDNAHNIWFSKDGKLMYVTEWHGSNFHTIDRMTNQELGSSFVFSGADVTHVMTTLPAENTGVLTLEGGPAGGLGFFDPNFPASIGNTSQITQIHLFSPLDHPHGPWISCSGAGNGGGIMIWPAPMSNRIGFTNLPATPTGPVSERTIVLSPSLYPVAVGARSDCTRSYTSNAVQGTVTVNDIQSGQVQTIVLLPLCLQCQILGIPAPVVNVPIQIPVSPDNRYAVVAMGKASQVAFIDTNTNQVVTTAECGAGCHGGNMAAKKGGGFYGWFTMQYQNKMSVMDMDTLQKAGDVPLNINSILTLQGLTPLAQPTVVGVAEGQSGGMGVGPFPLPAPWHTGINVIN
jgi:plastocyanin